MKVVTVVGARPQFVKAAPVSRQLRARHREVLVHTGQHYDPELADLFFDELDIPPPDHALGVGPGTPVQQMAAIMTALEPLLVADRPDAVRAITQRYTAALERLVRRHPDQYFWLHRRWKHTPPAKRARAA